MGAGTSSTVYGVVISSLISRRGSSDFENVVGAEDELELDNELDDELDDEELDDDELDDTCRLLAEVMVSIGSLGGLGGGTSCAAFGRGSAAGGTMTAASFSCRMTSGGVPTVSVACVGASVLPASPVLPGLFIRETLFFFSYKVEGGSTHIVLFLLLVFGYISVFVSCINGLTCCTRDFWNLRNSFFSSSV